MSLDVKFPKAQVKLVDEDGNAFSILGRTIKALRHAGATKEDIKQFQEEAMEGDYNHLLQTVMAWVSTDEDEEEEE